MRHTYANMIEMEAQHLGVDESAAGLLCPFCEGGRSRERTFSVKRIHDGILHNCFRASCTAGRGFVPTAGVLRAPAPMRENKPDRSYYGTYRGIEASDREYFLERFDLDVDINSGIGVNDENHYVMEIRRPDLLARGYAVRRGGWTGTPITPRSVRTDGPKTKIFMNDSTQVPMSWTHFPETGNVVVLVEDTISALKASQAGYVGVALLGTHLEANKVREIAMQKPSEVLIALDNDATAIALGMARTWGLAFGATRVVILEHDLKDISREEVEEVLDV